MLQKKRNPKYLPLSIMKLYFQKPIHIASKELSVSCSLLRSSLRSYGIRKWPYRYLQRLDKVINFLKDLQVEQDEHNNEMSDNGKRVSSIRRKIEVLVQRKQELEKHPELLGVREQEEFEITPQNIEFLVSNSLEASVEDTSSDNICAGQKNEIADCHGFSTSTNYHLTSLDNFENPEAFIPDKSRNCHTLKMEIERNPCNLNYQKSQWIEDPCRTFTEFIIKLGEEGIRNLQPSTILDLAKTYYSESLRFQGVNFQNFQF
ncbi:hypothetical protein GpartN1_g6668.t1 [Galdieria partita]|uniref:RWP-RK domain-containing protein n=1 Tax=Galdieria partita TaxID=83374 RepID=A0A9C7Q462_9RHOD|nr:hypothetical protein GpartN1_g6668.t1 [Galdieria partita]